MDLAPVLSPTVSGLSHEKLANQIDVIFYFSNQIITSAGEARLQAMRRFLGDEKFGSKEVVVSAGSTQNAKR
eukprot:snap_masked-scaffold_10-processed-gene-7.19-mRNA-1 protein AED:1.00 eAED:1.00 QI:0/0/0/0/1/1/2/0/71